MGPRGKMAPPPYRSSRLTVRSMETVDVSAVSDTESVTGIFSKAKAEFATLKQDRSLLSRDIEDMQHLFSTILLQLDRLEEQPKRRLKSHIMMEAYEKRKRRGGGQNETFGKTFTVQKEEDLPSSPLVNGARSGGSSLNTTRVVEESVLEDYRRFTPGMCSTYMHQSANSTDLDTSVGSLLDYSLITPESDSELQKSQVRGILKQSSQELSTLSSPKSPKRRRRRAKVRFAEESDSETESCDCKDCSKTHKVKETWDNEPELLLDDVYSSLSSSSAEEDAVVESGSTTLNATDVTISPAPQGKQNLTSFATEVLFPSPWLPDRRPEEDASFFEQIKREYERCCEQMKLDFPYSPNFKDLKQTEEDFCKEHCPDHELHEALGETCSLLINGSMSLLENSTLELERGSESGFESTQTTLDSSVDSNQTDGSSITSAHDMKRQRRSNTSSHVSDHVDSHVAIVEIHQPKPETSPKALPASLEATRGSTPDMTQVRTPDETGVQSNANTLPSMCEMNFQLDQTKLTIPESCRSEGLLESVKSSSTSPSVKSHNATVLYTSPASVLSTPCPTLVPIDTLSPVAPQNSPLYITEGPLVNSPASFNSTVLPLMNFETLSPMSASPVCNSPSTPDAPKRQTRRFPTVPKKFVRRLDFKTPAKDIKRKESIAKRLKTDKKSKIEESDNEETENQKEVKTTYKRKNIKKRLKLFSNFFKKDRDCESHVVETLAHI